MSEKRKYNRWHLQPEDFVVVDHRPVSELQKKDVEEWISAISSSNKEVHRVRKTPVNYGTPPKRREVNASKVKVREILSNRNSQQAIVAAKRAGIKGKRNRGMDRNGIDSIPSIKAISRLKLPRHRLRPGITV